MSIDQITAWLEPFAPFADDAVMLGCIILLWFSLSSISRTRRKRVRRDFKAAIDSLLDDAAIALVAGGVLELQVYWEDMSTELTLVVTLEDRKFQVISRSDVSPVVSMLDALDLLFRELERIVEDRAASFSRDAEEQPDDPSEARDDPPAAQPPAARHWWDILGIGPKASRAEIERSWRDLAKRHHPDLGGSAEAMAEINRARDEARNASA